MTTKKSTPDTVESFFKAGKEQFEGAVKASSQATKKNLEQTIESTKKQFEEVVKGYGDVADFNRENMDAYVAASNAAAKGIEALNAEIFDYSKKIYEANLAAYKSLAGVKSPKEFFDIQNDLLKSRYEETLSEVNKINEIVSVAANEAAAPLSARVSEATEKFSKAVG